MAERFFTNALSLGGALAGTEQLPYDIVAGGSAFTTPAQIETYCQAPIIAATEAALLAARTPTSQYTADSSTSGFTATAAEVSLAANVATAPGLVVLDLTGALGAGANIQMPLASDIISHIAATFTGLTYLLRIVNNSSGAFPWTLTVNTGVTINGTATIAQNTWREWLVTVTGGAAISLQNVGSGVN